MSAAGRVVVVGSANMDLVVRTPRLPAAGETVLGGDLLRVPGGKGANQAVAAARAGAPVRFVGALGGDAFGDELLAALLADGVDVTQVTRVGRPTGTALIVVDEAGENLSAVAPGANFALQAAAVDAGLADLTAADVVLTQLEVPLACVAAAAASSGRTILNAAPAGPLDAAVLARVEVLVVNEAEGAALSGSTDPVQAAHALRAEGPSSVIVTLGGEGLLLADDGGITRLPAHKIDVVDATAAGDAFCGALAAALARGATMPQAVRFANAAAALATTRPGAQPSLPHWQAIMALLDERP